jgi:hypothetical protein
MTLPVLDSGAITRLSERSSAAVALLRTLREAGLWPPLVPTDVLVECLTGDVGKDAKTNRLLKSCSVAEGLPERIARRAAMLRARARRGSAVDAIVVAMAEPDGTVLTADAADLRSLAVHASAVTIATI